MEEQLKKKKGETNKTKKIDIKPEEVELPAKKENYQYMKMKGERIKE